MASQMSTKTNKFKKFLSVIVLVFSVLLTSLTFGGCKLFGDIDTTSSMYDESGNLRLVTPLVNYHPSREYYVYNDGSTFAPVNEVGQKTFYYNLDDGSDTAEIILQWLEITHRNTQNLYAKIAPNGPIYTSDTDKLMPATISLYKKDGNVYKIESARTQKTTYLVLNGGYWNFEHSSILYNLGASLRQIGQYVYGERFINVTENGTNKTYTLLNATTGESENTLSIKEFVDETTGSFSFELGYYWKNSAVDRMFFNKNNESVQKINDVKYDAAGYVYNTEGGETYNSSLINSTNISFPNYTILIDGRKVEIELRNITYDININSRLSPLANLDADIYYRVSGDDPLTRGETEAFCFVKADESYFDIYQDQSNGMWYIRYFPRLENGSTSRTFKVKAISRDSSRGDSLYSNGITFEVYRQSFKTYSNNSAFINYGGLNYDNNLTPARVEDVVNGGYYIGEARMNSASYYNSDNPTKNYYFYNVEKKVDTTDGSSRVVGLTGFFPEGRLVQVQRMLDNADYALQSWTTNTEAENGRVFANTIYSGVEYDSDLRIISTNQCLDYSTTISSTGFTSVPTDVFNKTIIPYYVKNVDIDKILTDQDLFWDDLDTDNERATQKVLISNLTTVAHSNIHNYTYYANYEKVNNFTLTGSLFNGDHLFDVGGQYLDNFTVSLHRYEADGSLHTYTDSFESTGVTINIVGHTYEATGLKYGDFISFAKSEVPSGDKYSGTYANATDFTFYSIKMVDQDVNGIVKKVLKVGAEDNYLKGYKFYSDQKNVGIIGTQYKSNTNLQINVYLAGQDNKLSFAPAAVYNTSSGDLVLADGTGLRYEIIKTADSYVDEYGYVTTNVILALQTESDSTIYAYNFETLSSINDLRYIEMDKTVLDDHLAIEYFYDILNLKYTVKPYVNFVTVEEIEVTSTSDSLIYKYNNKNYKFSYREGDKYFYKIDEKQVPAPYYGDNEVSSDYVKYIVKDNEQWYSLHYDPIENTFGFVGSAYLLYDEVNSSTPAGTEYIIENSGFITVGKVGDSISTDYSLKFTENYYSSGSLITREFYAAGENYIVRHIASGTSTYYRTNASNSDFTYNESLDCIDYNGKHYKEVASSANTTSTVATVYKTEMIQYNTVYQVESLKPELGGNPLTEFTISSKTIDTTKFSPIYAYYDVSRASDGNHYLTAQLGIMSTIPQVSGNPIYNYKFYFEALGDSFINGVVNDENTDDDEVLTQQTSQSNFYDLLKEGKIMLGSDIVKNATSATPTSHIRAFYLMMGSKITTNAYYYVAPLAKAEEAYVTQEVRTIKAASSTISYVLKSNADEVYTGEKIEKVVKLKDILVYNPDRDTFSLLNPGDYMIDPSYYEFIELTQKYNQASTVNKKYHLVVYGVNNVETVYEQNTSFTATDFEPLKNVTYKILQLKNVVDEDDGKTIADYFSVTMSDNITSDSYCYIYTTGSYEKTFDTYTLMYDHDNNSSTPALSLETTRQYMPIIYDLFDVSKLNITQNDKFLIAIEKNNDIYTANFSIVDYRNENIYNCETVSANLKLDNGSLYYGRYKICDDSDITSSEIIFTYGYKSINTGMIEGLYIDGIRIADVPTDETTTLTNSNTDFIPTQTEIWNNDLVNLVKNVFGATTVVSARDTLEYTITAAKNTDDETKYDFTVEFTLISFAYIYNSATGMYEYQTTETTETVVILNKDVGAGNYSLTLEGVELCIITTEDRNEALWHLYFNKSGKFFSFINTDNANVEQFVELMSHSFYHVINSNSTYYTFKLVKGSKTETVELIRRFYKGDDPNQYFYSNSYTGALELVFFGEDENGDPVELIQKVEAPEDSDNVLMNGLVRSAQLFGDEHTSKYITILGKYTITNDPEEPMVYPTYTTQIIYMTSLGDTEGTTQVFKPGNSKVVASDGGFDHYYSLDYTIPDSAIEGMPGVTLLDGAPYPNPVLYFSVRHLATESAVLNISLDVRNAFSVEIMGSKIDTDTDLLLDFSTYAFRDTLANLMLNDYIDSIYYVIERNSYKPFNAYFEVSEEKFFNLAPEARYEFGDKYYGLWNSGEPLTIQNVGLNSEDDSFIYFIDEMNASGKYTKHVYYLVDDGLGGYKMEKLTTDAAIIWESSADRMEDLPIYDLHTYEQGKDGIIYFSSGTYNDDNLVCEGMEGISAGATSKTDGVFNYDNVLISGVVNAYRSNAKFNTGNTDNLGYWSYEQVSTINAFDSSDPHFIGGKETAVFVASPIVRTNDNSGINDNILYRFSHWLVYTRYNSQLMYLNREYTYNKVGGYANTGAVFTFSPAENESGYFVFMPVYERVLTISIGTQVYDGPANLGGMVSFQYKDGEAVDASNPKDYDMYLLEYFKTMNGGSEGYFYSEIQTVPYYVVTGFIREAYNDREYIYRPVFAPNDSYSIFKIPLYDAGSLSAYSYYYYNELTGKFGIFANTSEFTTNRGVTLYEDTSITQGTYSSYTSFDLTSYLSYKLVDENCISNQIIDLTSGFNNIGPLLIPVATTNVDYSVNYKTLVVPKNLIDESSFNAAKTSLYNTTEKETVHYTDIDNLNKYLNYSNETMFVPESLTDSIEKDSYAGVKTIAYRDPYSNYYYAISITDLYSAILTLSDEDIANNVKIDKTYLTKGDLFAHMFTKEFLLISALSSYPTSDGYFSNSSNSLLTGELYYNDDHKVYTTVQYKNAYFDRDTNVIITATPDYGYRFEGWYQSVYNPETNTWDISNRKLTDAAATYLNEIIPAVYNAYNDQYYYITEYYGPKKQSYDVDGNLLTYRTYYLDAAKTIEAIVPDAMLGQVRGQFIIQNNKYVRVFYSSLTGEFYYDDSFTLPVGSGHLYTKYELTLYEIADRYYNPERYTEVDHSRGINTTNGYNFVAYAHPDKFYNIDSEMYNRYYITKENGNVFINGNVITIQKLHSNIRFVAKFIETYKEQTITTVGDDEGIVVVDMYYYNTDSIKGDRTSNNIRTDLYGDDLTQTDKQVKGLNNSYAETYNIYDDAKGLSTTLNDIATSGNYKFNTNTTWLELKNQLAPNSGTSYWINHLSDRDIDNDGDVDNKDQDNSLLTNTDFFFDVNTTTIYVVKVKRGYSLAIHTLGLGSTAYNVTPILEPEESYIDLHTQNQQGDGVEQVDYFYYIFKITFDRNADTSENDNAHLIRHPYRAMSLVGDILAGRDYDFYQKFFNLYDNEGVLLTNYINYNSTTKLFSLKNWADVKDILSPESGNTRISEGSYIKAQKKSANSEEFTNIMVELNRAVKDEFAFFVGGVTTKDVYADQNGEFLFDLFGGKITEITTDMDQIFESIKTIIKYANFAKNGYDETKSYLAKGVGPFMSGIVNYFNLSGLVIYTFNIQSMLIDGVNANGSLIYNTDSIPEFSSTIYADGGMLGYLFMNAVDTETTLVDPIVYTDIAGSTTMNFYKEFQMPIYIPKNNESVNSYQTQDLSIVESTMLLLKGFEGFTLPDDVAFLGWYEAKCEEVIDEYGAISRKWTDYELMSSDLTLPYVTHSNADTSIIALFKRIRDFEFKFDNTMMDVIIHSYQYDGKSFTYTTVDNITTITGKVFIDQDIDITVTPNGGYRFSLSNDNIKLTGTNGEKQITDTILTTNVRNYLGDAIKCADVVLNDTNTFTIDMGQFLFVVNEDLNRNGKLDDGEDKNENGVLDIPNNAISLEFDDVKPILLFYFEVAGFYKIENGKNYHNGANFTLGNYFATNGSISSNLDATVGSFIKFAKDDTNALLTAELKGLDLHIYGYFDRERSDLEIVNSGLNDKLENYYINNSAKTTSEGFKDENDVFYNVHANPFPIKFLYEDNKINNEYNLSADNMLYHIKAHIPAIVEITVDTSLYESVSTSNASPIISSDTTFENIINLTYNGQYVGTTGEGLGAMNGYASINYSSVFAFDDETKITFSIDNTIIEHDGKLYAFMGWFTDYICLSSETIFTIQASQIRFSNVTAQFVLIKEITLTNAEGFEGAGSYDISQSKYNLSVNDSCNNVVNYNNKTYIMSGTSLNIEITTQDSFEVDSITVNQQKIDNIDDLTLRINSNYFDKDINNIVINYTIVYKANIQLLEYDSVELQGKPKAFKAYFNFDGYHLAILQPSSPKVSTFSIDSLEIGDEFTIRNLTTEINGLIPVKIFVNGEQENIPSDGSYEATVTGDMDIKICYVPYITINVSQQVPSDNYYLYLQSLYFRYKNQYGSEVEHIILRDSFKVPAGTVINIDVPSKYVTTTLFSYAFTGMKANGTLISTDTNFNYQVPAISQNAGKTVDLLFEYNKYKQYTYNTEVFLNDGDTLDDMKNTFQIHIAYVDIYGHNKTVTLSNELFTKGLTGNVYKNSFTFYSAKEPIVTKYIDTPYADQYFIEQSSDSTNILIRITGAIVVNFIPEVDGQPTNAYIFKFHFDGSFEKTFSYAEEIAYPKTIEPTITMIEKSSKLTFAGWYVNGKFVSSNEGFTITKDMTNETKKLMIVAKFLETNVVTVIREVDGELSNNSSLTVKALGSFVHDYIDPATDSKQGIFSEINSISLDNYESKQFIIRKNIDLMLVADNIKTHIFLGWYVNDEFVSSDFNYTLSGTSYYLNTAKVTAKYATKYNISYVTRTINGEAESNAIGGTISTPEKTIFTVSDIGTSITLPEVYVNTGYTFVGYFINGEYKFGSYSNIANVDYTFNAANHLVIEARFVKNFNIDIRLAVENSNYADSVIDLIGGNDYADDLNQTLLIAFKYPYSETFNATIPLTLYKPESSVLSYTTSVPYGTEINIRKTEDNINNQVNVNYNFQGFYIYNNEQPSSSISVYSYSNSFSFTVEKNIATIAKYDKTAAPDTYEKSESFEISDNGSTFTKVNKSALTMLDASIPTVTYNGNTYLFIGWYAEIKETGSSYIKISNNYNSAISNGIIHKVARFVKLVDITYNVTLDGTLDLNTYNITGNIASSYVQSALGNFLSSAYNDNSYHFKVLAGTSYNFTGSVINGFAQKGDVNDMTLDEVGEIAITDVAHSFETVQVGYLITYKVSNGNYSSTITKVVDISSIIKESTTRDEYEFTFKVEGNEESDVEYVVIVNDIYSGKEIQSFNFTKETNDTAKFTAKHGELITIYLLNRNKIDMHMSYTVNNIEIPGSNKTPAYQFYALNFDSKDIVATVGIEHQVIVENQEDTFGFGVTELDRNVVNISSIDGYAISHVMIKVNGVDSDFQILNQSFTETSKGESYGITDVAPTSIIVTKYPSLLPTSDGYAIKAIKITISNELLAKYDVQIKPYYVKLVSLYINGIDPNDYTLDEDTYTYYMYDADSNTDTANWTGESNSDPYISSLKSGDFYESDLKSVILALSSKSDDDFLKIARDSFVNVSYNNDKFDMTFNIVGAVDEIIFNPTTSNSSIHQVMINHSRYIVYQIYAIADIKEFNTDINSLIKARIVYPDGSTEELEITEFTSTEITFKSVYCHLSDAHALEIYAVNNSFTMNGYSNSRDLSKGIFTTSSRVTLSDGIHAGSTVGSQSGYRYSLYAHLTINTRTISIDFDNDIYINNKDYEQKSTENNRYNYKLSADTQVSYIESENNYTYQLKGSNKTIVYPVGRYSEFTITPCDFIETTDILSGASVYEYNHYRITNFVNAKTLEILNTNKYDNSISINTENFLVDSTIQIQTIKLVTPSVNVVKSTNTTTYDGDYTQKLEVYYNSSWQQISTTGAYVEPHLLVRVSSTYTRKNNDSIPYILSATKKVNKSLSDITAFNTIQNTLDSDGKTILAQTLTHVFTANADTAITFNYHESIPQNKFVIVLSALHGLGYMIEGSTYSKDNFSFDTYPLLDKNPLSAILITEFPTGAQEEYISKMIRDVKAIDIETYNTPIQTKFNIELGIDYALLSKIINVNYFSTGIDVIINQLKNLYDSTKADGGEEFVALRNKYLYELINNSWKTKDTYILSLADKNQTTDIGVQEDAALSSDQKAEVSTSASSNKTTDYIFNKYTGLNNSGVIIAKDTSVTLKAEIKDNYFFKGFYSVTSAYVSPLSNVTTNLSNKEVLNHYIDAVSEPTSPLNSLMSLIKIGSNYNISGNYYTADATISADTLIFALYEAKTFKITVNNVEASVALDGESPILDEEDQQIVIEPTDYSVHNSDLGSVTGNLLVEANSNAMFASINYPGFKIVGWTGYKTTNTAWVDTNTALSSQVLSWTGSDIQFNNGSDLDADISSYKNQMNIDYDGLKATTKSYSIYNPQAITGDTENRLYNKTMQINAVESQLSSRNNLKVYAVTEDITINAFYLSESLVINIKLAEILGVTTLTDKGESSTEIVFTEEVHKINKEEDVNSLSPYVYTNVDDSGHKLPYFTKIGLNLIDLAKSKATGHLIYKNNEPVYVNGISDGSDPYFRYMYDGGYLVHASGSNYYIKYTPIEDETDFDGLSEIYNPENNKNIQIYTIMSYYSNTTLTHINDYIEKVDNNDRIKDEGYSLIEGLINISFGSTPEDINTYYNDVKKRVRLDIDFDNKTITIKLFVQNENGAFPVVNVQMGTKNSLIQDNVVTAHSFNVSAVDYTKNDSYAYDLYSGKNILSTNMPTSTSSNQISGFYINRQDTDPMPSNINLNIKANFMYNAQIVDLKFTDIGGEPDNNNYPKADCHNKYWEGKNAKTVTYLGELYKDQDTFRNAYKQFTNNFSGMYVTIIKGTETYLSRLNAMLDTYFPNPADTPKNHVDAFLENERSFAEELKRNIVWGVGFNGSEQRNNLYAAAYTFIVQLINILSSVDINEDIQNNILSTGYVNITDILDHGGDVSIKRFLNIDRLINILFDTNFKGYDDLNNFFEYKTINVGKYMEYLNSDIYTSGNVKNYQSSNFADLIATNYNFGDTIRFDSYVTVHNAEQTNLSVSEKTWILPRIVWWADKGYKYYKTLTNCGFTITSVLGTHDAKSTSALNSSSQSNEMTIQEAINILSLKQGPQVEAETLAFTSTTPEKNAFGGSIGKDITHLQISLDDTQRIYYQDRDWDEIPAGIIGIATVTAVGVGLLTYFTAGLATTVIGTVLLALSVAGVAVYTIALIDNLINKLPNNSPFRNIFM